jgi:hypothetical protein
LLITTTIKGQDTLKLDTVAVDSSYVNGHNDGDSIKVQQNCHDMKTEQRELNMELKRQLEYLKNLMKEEEKDPDSE